MLIGAKASGLVCQLIGEQLDTGQVITWPSFPPNGDYFTFQPSRTNRWRTGNVTTTTRLKELFLEWHLSSGGG